MTSKCKKLFLILKFLEKKHQTASQSATCQETVASHNIWTYFEKWCQWVSWKLKCFLNDLSNMLWILNLTIILLRLLSPICHHTDHCRRLCKSLFGNDGTCGFANFLDAIMFSGKHTLSRCISNSSKNILQKSSTWF